MTISEAISTYTPDTQEKSKENRLKSKLVTALSPMQRVGLGYLRLGQALNTLSGGESQRLKLCQLGLHFTDIEKLLNVFQDLVDVGHTLLVIEHQLDVIKAADHIIDIGPGAGEDGGKIVYALNQINKKTSKSIAPPKPNNNQISVYGAREHNLKNFDISIPRDELVVVTGLSGSGKSTLSFDIIFAEGQRRFLDSMSPYARQFANQLEKPDIDKIEGLPPTVAIEQRVSRGGGKSTVGTVTEIYHFMRLLYAKLGIQHCPVSKEPVISQTLDSITQQIKKKLHSKGDWKLLAQLIKAKKGFHTDVAAAAQKQGVEELIVDGVLTNIEDFTPLARYKEHDIFAVIPINKDLTTAVERCQKVGSGQIAVANITTQKVKVSRKFEMLPAIQKLTASTHQEDGAQPVEVMEKLLVQLFKRRKNGRVRQTSITLKLKLN